MNLKVGTTGPDEEVNLDYKKKSRIMPIFLGLNSWEDLLER